MDEKRRAARWRKRRIIYNNDGDDALEARSGVEHNHDVAEALMTRKTGELTDDFLNARSTPLAGSQVDSNWYCSCMAGLTFSHNTKLGGFVGKGIPQELVDKYGRDSLQIQVDFSHEQVVPVEGADTSNRDAGLRQGRSHVCEEAHELPVHRHGEADPDQPLLDARVRMPFQEGLQKNIVL